MEIGPVRPVAKVGATLGEGPCWDVERQWLWFVDIKGQRLYRLNPDTGASQSWNSPGEIGWVLPTAKNDLLCGLADGLYRFNPEAGEFRFDSAVEEHLPGNRLNDACTDRQGNLWFGSMDNAEEALSGFFYRHDGRDIEALDFEAICITNGPAISPDGRTIYLTDTLGRRIWAAPLDDGQVGAARLFKQFGDEPGYPDGPVVDSAGNVWTGMFAGWGVRCFSPDGELLAYVRFPVANVTKIAFGGPDLKTVYATSAAKGLSPDELGEQPMAGDIFAFDVDIAGLATTALHF